MPMSKDRVEFDFREKPPDKEANVEAARRAFNISCHEGRRMYDEEKRIRCRPSQFARFLIFRAEGVSVNQFSTSNVKLIQPECIKLIDVSENENRMC